MRLSGLLDADLPAEPTEEDWFLAPMKRAIVIEDVTSFNKLGSLMAHFWSKAALFIDCVIVDNNLAIPEPLRKTALARLHRYHPGQQAMRSASEYIWWTFLNRQIVDVCERCRECTLYGKKLKTAKIFHTAQALPTLSGPNQELQLDFAGPILDNKDTKVFVLVAVDHFSKFPSVLITKATGAKKFLKCLKSFIRIHGIPRSIRTYHGSELESDLARNFCATRFNKRILSPVGDHRSSAFVEPSIQTIKQKLGTAKLDPNFGNLKSTV